MRISLARRIAMTSVAAASLTAITLGPAVADVPAFAGGVAPMASTGPLIDAEAPTKLTIHKHLGAPTGGVANGLPVTVDRPTLSGIVYDVYKVGSIDLSTNAGWATASALQGHTVTQADITAKKIGTHTLTLAGSVTTSSGEAVFNGTAAVYVVVENLSKSTNITVSTGGTLPASSITPSAPFLITLPMTHPTSLNTWLYDVHAYPKSTSDTITKTVTDAKTHVGHATTSKRNFTYSIESSTTPGLTAAQVGSYVVMDDLSDGVTLLSASVRTKTGATTLTRTTDYNIYLNDSATAWDGTTATTNGPKVEIVLTPAGLTKAIGGEGIITILNVRGDTGTVYASPAMLMPSDGWWAAHTGSDVKYAHATDDPNKKGNTTLTPPSSDAVRSIFANVVVTNQDAKTAATKLQGAEFEVRLDDGIAAYDPSKDLVVGTFTTNASGVGTLTGLQASGFYNGAVQSDKNTYWLVQTKAPAGYNLQAQPMSFEIAHSGTAATATATNRALTVNSAKSNLDSGLPLTGGAGLAGLSAMGLLALAAGGAYAVRARRNEKAVNPA